VPCAFGAFDPVSNDEVPIPFLHVPSTWRLSAHAAAALLQRVMMEFAVCVLHPDLLWFCVEVMKRFLFCTLCIPDPPPLPVLTLSLSLQACACGLCPRGYEYYGFASSFPPCLPGRCLGTVSLVVGPECLGCGLSDLVSNMVPSQRLTHHPALLPGDSDDEGLVSSLGCLVFTLLLPYLFPPLACPAGWQP
jgi:hypothetical protein